MKFLQALLIKYTLYLPPMFATLAQKMLLIVYVFILLSIPVGSYLVSEYKTTVKSDAGKPKKTIAPVPIPTSKPISSPISAVPPAKELLDQIQNDLETSDSSNGSPDTTNTSSSPTIADTYGPTLSLKVTLEGRPQTNQATRLFVGILEGNLTSNPKFLLSFTIDLPASGQYSGLSLAGLNSGTRYTALLKGSAQIATSSAFTMSPTTTRLNNNEALIMLSGDLNEDNTINSADYSIAQKRMGTTPKSANWNSNADFNKDDVINSLDLSIITKNMGKSGASGAWTSPIPQIASPSASLSEPAIGSPGSGGYWIWVPW